MPRRTFAAVCIVAIAAQMAAAQAPRLTVERVASLPNLSGTPPVNPVWSPDGSRLAFLWNDAGMPFRDLWVVGAASGDPTRITDMARDYPPRREAPQSEDAVLADRVAARANGGIAGTVACCRPYPGELYSPVWTPDGSALVFAYEGDLFRVRSDGSDLSRLTSTPAGEYQPAFSPDGAFLSFLQDGDLWLWKQGTNDRLQVTHLAAAAPAELPDAEYARRDAEIFSYRWAPDSRTLALYVEDRSHVRRLLIPHYLGAETVVNAVRKDHPGDYDQARKIAFYSVSGGRTSFVRLPDDTDRRISNYGWSPDGKRLLIDQNSADAEHRWILSAEPAGEFPRELWHDHRATRNTQLWTSTWAADGEGVVFVADLDGQHHLYSLSPGSRTPIQLTRGDWDVVGESGSASLAVSRAAGQIFFISTQRNAQERQVYRMAATGGPVQPVTSLAGTHQPFVSPDGRRIALLHSNDTTPPELYIVDAAGGAERRITRSPLKEFSAYPWIEPKYVTFKSHVDGATLHGRLLEPPNLDRSKKYPVILGPVYPNTVRNRWADREEWRGVYNTLQQYLALEGQYIGFHVDVRGSVGHGQKFAEDLRPYGGLDVDDLQSGVEYLKTLPYVDPSRIGIWGSSYGGLLTVMSLFKKPGVYQAGVASAPATNLWHASSGLERVLRRPASHPERYRSASAIGLGDDLEDHLLIIHGMQDTVVLFKDSVTLAEKLMLLGKRFDIAVAPSAEHGWSRKDYVAVYFARKLVDYFDRHLGRGPR